MPTFLKTLARSGFHTLARLESRFDEAFLAKDVPLSGSVDLVAQLQSMHLPQGYKPRVLEIGSREVAEKSEARARFSHAEYVGFDFYGGANVDVVGDVHKLSTYFAPGERFDLIYSYACFEHFAMPWLAAVEITKMLKVGGILFIATHFSYGAHERPWNFFQFSDMGLRVLFSSALGIECIAAGMSNPIVGRFSRMAGESVRLMPVSGLYNGSEFLGRKVRDVPAFDWSQVSLDEVVGGTTYPPPETTPYKAHT